MSYWNAFARKYPQAATLRVDGGSVFNPGVVEATVTNRWMLEGTHRSRLDALNLTAWDISAWQELGDLAAAGQVAKDILQVPLVSANATPKLENFPRVERYVIKEFRAGGKPVHVGVTGLLFDPEERLSRREFKVEDPSAAAAAVIEAMKERTDYRVVLTELDLGKAISLALAVPGIDLMVVSHNYAALTDPQQVGGALVAMPINEGRFLGELRLDFSAGPRPKLENRFVGLDRTVPDEPQLGELVRRAQTELDEFRKAAK